MAHSGASATCNTMIKLEVTNILRQSPGYLGWKDTHLRHAGCNDNLARIYQFSHPEQIVNLTDADLPGNTDTLYDYHKRNDELALAGNTIKAIHQSSLPYDGSLYFFEKKPLFDSENHICGLIYHCQEMILNDFLINLLETDKRFSSASKQYYLAATTNTRALSTRELECLFCTLRGLNANETGKRMGLSKRTIESYLENIKNKFGSRTKQELVIMATAEGYCNIIPERFITIGKKLFN